MYDQRWSDDWIRSEFEADYKDEIFADILGSLARRLGPARRRLLDVGAHAGRFVSLAQAAGWTAEGLELNPKTAAYAAQRTGASIRQLNVHDARVGDGVYDAITLTDVLEHIPDPVRVLTRTASLLAPDGWMAVKVPCGPSQLLKETWRGRLLSRYRPTVADNLVHVSHFSPASLRGRSSARDSSTLPSGLGRRSCRRRRGCGALCRAPRGGPSTTPRGVLPGGLHTPLTFNLQAYGRRPAAERER